MIAPPATGAWSPGFRAFVESWPAGPKLVGLMVVATALLLVERPDVLGVAVTLALLAGLLALGPRGLGRAIPVGLVLAVAIVVGFTLLVDGPARALSACLRLSALILLAQLVTATTRASAIQDALVAGLRPFEFLPFVSAEKAGLALAITLRSLPRLTTTLRDLREAQAARGLAPHPVRLVVPLVARILKDARETADAIDARAWSGGRKAP